MKRLLLMVLLLTPLMDLGAQEAPQIRHQIGLSSSNISGSGISYQLTKEPYGLRITGFALYMKDEEDDEDILEYNIGLGFQKVIHQTEKTTLYGLIGGNYWYDKEEEEDGSRESIDKHIEVGVGMGIRALFWKHISVNLDAGVAYRDEISGSGKRIGPGGGLGIGYLF